MPFISFRGNVSECGSNVTKTRGNAGEAGSSIKFSGNITEFGGKRVVKLLDYAPGIDGLPKSDVLKFLLEDKCSIVVRPSGTEPKLKIYISVSAKDKETAEKIEEAIVKRAEEKIKAQAV